MRPLHDTVSAIYVMSHVWMSHGTIFVWEWGHSVPLLASICRVIHTHESCYLYQCECDHSATLLVPHMCHVTHMNESWHIHEWEWGHSATLLVSCVSCHTCECVMEPCFSEIEATLRHRFFLIWNIHGDWGHSSPPVVFDIYGTTGGTMGWRRIVGSIKL